jgi:hypothetical protein
MLWEDILRTLGGMAILVSALAWLSRSLLTSLLSKDIERFKSDLQVSSQKSVEAFKSSLQLEAQRHAVEYSALHSKRAELIAELYSQIVGLNRGIMGLSRELGAREYRAEEYAKTSAAKPEPWILRPGIHTLSETEEAKATALHQASREFLQFYSGRKIYFSQEVCEMIDSFVTLAGYMGVMYQNVALKDDDGQLFVNPMVLQVWENAGEKIPHLQASLEKEFRALLGVMPRPNPSEGAAGVSGSE